MRNSRGGYRALWLLSVVLNVAVLGLGVYLLGFSSPNVAPPADRHIAVPYAANASIWEPLHRWVIQEDGRLKPFETFCGESVRTITGRERFEDNDPVAVVASWLLLYDPDHNRALDIGAAMNADWERYPFILCDDHELRAALYRDYRGPEAELSEEDRHGKYVEPVVLRLLAGTQDASEERGRENGEGRQGCTDALGDEGARREETAGPLRPYPRRRPGGSGTHPRSG